MMKNNLIRKFIQVYWIVLFLLFNIFVQLTHGLTQIQTEKEKHVKTFEIHAVEGRRISLECPLSAPSRDKVYMVLWFRDGAGIPLYSFDVRGLPLSQARHWSAPEIFGTRAKFNTDTDPATLDIEDIRRHDEGVYRCRVDFRTSQTQSFRYNLTVIILPEHPIVLNRWGRQLNGTVLGPKEEGDDIMLTCRVIGGRPQPQVRWLVNGKIVDDQFEHNSGDVIDNRLLWPSVQRSNLNAIFTCQALNTILVDPKESSFVLDLHLKPLTVKIYNPQSPLVADRRYEISCESTGSRPNAIITWYKGKRQLKRTREETINDNTTHSELSFAPSTEDHDKSITCRAENPKVTGLFLETSWKLDVVYPPIVLLRLGSTLSADDIKDGDDVYFECHVQSNPQLRKLYWLHDGVMITHNASARIIRSNQSLVLQKVNKNSGGNYSCSVINAEGETVSNQLALRVKYAPVCVTDKIVIVGAFRGEILHIPCDVEADPFSHMFRWKFNNSGEQLDIGKDRYYRNGSRSILKYIPVTDQDYGTLSCWAENSVGVQRHPCLFQVVIAGLPSTVKNCTINNQTQHSVEVQCIAGYDGGLPQVFVLELVSIKTGKLRYNITNPEDPYFFIEALDSLASADLHDDNALKAIVFAVNQKGRSQGVILKDFLLENNAENRAAHDDAAMDISPILLGIFLTLLFLCIIICLKVYCTKASLAANNTRNSEHLTNANNFNSKHDATKKNPNITSHWQNHNGDNHNGKEIKFNTDVVEDERDPDVIPAQYVSDDVVENSYPMPQWSNGNYYDRYPNHDIRPKDLLLTPAVSSALATHQPTQLQVMNAIKSSQSHAALKGDIIANSTGVAIGAGVGVTSVINPNDYDINVHSIKNMLMTTRVPESCV